MEKKCYISLLRQLGAFWSYAPSADIPDEVLIEEALRWGNVEELKILFKIFDTRKIKMVWREKMLPDEQIYRHNFYLAIIFFNIKNPKRYISIFQKKYNRCERLKQFIA
ncbi:MAG: hypothetical protein ACK4EX_03740 [Thermaurantimonas sp.]|uniref:hypothetical protein n=1 Tax=Thermaurantimonas sp. TaxID=2681568 RepID=UPI00391CB2AF